jgi:SAM-dependent methyltransferase
MDSLSSRFLTVDSTERMDRLRAALEVAGYARPEAARVLAAPADSEPRRIDLPLYLRRLDADSPLHTLIRLFALHVPVPEAAARRALGPLGLEEAAAIGIVGWRDDEVRPLVGIVVTDGLLLARDIPEASARTLPKDYVLGLNPPALLLARLTVRLKVRSALDVGCGGGVQALLAARHAERVIGVDINPRAIAFARFNAQLNGVTNVEFRQGNLFEPVACERFDLIVSNPPYVVSPESGLLFRDGGRSGDSFSEEVVHGVARHLVPGGFGTALVNWVLREGRHWSEPLCGWVEGESCDTVLMQLETQDALTYAATWTRDPDAASYAAALDRWVAHYQQHGIRSIGLAAVLLRRRAAGTPWVSTVEMFSQPRGCASPSILRVFETQDRLSHLSEPDALLAERFRPSEALRVMQAAAMQDGRFQLHGSQLRLEGALPFEGAPDAGTLRLLQLSDGRRTLREIVAEMGPASGHGADALVTSVLDTVRKLLTLGFLVPAETAGGRRRHEKVVVGVEPSSGVASPRAVGGRGPRRPRHRATTVRTG